MGLVLVKVQGLDLDAAGSRSSEPPAARYWDGASPETSCPHPCAWRTCYAAKGASRSSSAGPREIVLGYPLWGPEMGRGAAAEAA